MVRNAEDCCDLIGLFALFGCLSTDKIIGSPNRSDWFSAGFKDEMRFAAVLEKNLIAGV